ncbi:hypothetical protein KAH81_03615 [bacterium]|nr:hypothetical protein [bacterium]
MSRMKIILILSVAFALTVLSFPYQIGYQGKLTDRDGVAIDDSVTIGFSLWNSDFVGDSLWGEEDRVMATKGLFDAILGDVVPMIVDFSEMLWVQLIVDGEVLSPRQPLNAVPVALYANYADSLVGGVIINHNDMDGLQGGDSHLGQYYHLTASQVTQIADNATNIGSLIYSENNYVIDGEPLTSSIDALDQVVADIEAGTSNTYIRNQELVAQDADIWIDGNAKVDGNLEVGNIVGQGTGDDSVTPIVSISSTTVPATLAEITYTAAGAGSEIQLSFAGTFDDRGGQDGAYVNVEIVRNPGPGEVAISQVSVSIYSSVVHQFQNVAINGVDNPPAGAHTYAVRAIVAKDPYTSGRCLNGVLQLAEIKD